MEDLDPGPYYVPSEVAVKRRTGHSRESLYYGATRNMRNSERQAAVKSQSADNRVSQWQPT